MSRSSNEISHVGDDEECEDEPELQLEAYEESLEGEGTQSDILYYKRQKKHIFR